MQIVIWIAEEKVVDKGRIRRADGEKLVTFASGGDLFDGMYAVDNHVYSGVIM